MADQLFAEPWAVRAAHRGQLAAHVPLTVSRALRVGRRAAVQLFGELGDRQVAPAAGKPLAQPGRHCAAVLVVTIAVGCMRQVHASLRTPAADVSVVHKESSDPERDMSACNAPASGFEVRSNRGLACMASIGAPAAQKTAVFSCKPTCAASVLRRSVAIRRAVAHPAYGP